MKPPLRLLKTLLHASLLLNAAVLHAQSLDFDILGLQNEDFFQAPSVANVRISADGQRIAYTRTTYDGDSIHVLDRASGETRVILKPNPSEQGIAYLAWLDPQTILFQNNQGDLSTQNVDTFLKEKIFDADRTLFFRNAIVHANVTRPRVLSTLPGDPERILVSAFDDKGIRRVYQLPIKKWDPANLPPPLFPNAKDFDLWHADFDGNVRLAMKLSQRGTTLYQRLGDTDRWQEMSSLLRSEGTALNLDLSKKSVLQKRDFLLGFDFDPNRFYFASNQQTDTAALYLYDIEKGQIVQQLAHDPTYDLIDTTTGAAAAVLSPTKRAWVGIHYDAQKPQTIWFDPAFQTLQSQIDALLPDSQNLLVDWSQDEATYIVQALWSERPPEHYAYTPENQSLEQIGPGDHPLAREPGSPSIPVQFTGSAGHAIHGYYTPAKNPTTTPAPLVMLVHGGPWARDSWTYDPFTQCLAHNGYSTLRVNYRGSTGYGFAHFAAAAQDYGWAVQDDIRDARQWAIDQNYAAPDKIAIMGFSYGGYAAALSAASQPQAFQCAVPISGIYDILLESKEIKKQNGRGITYEYWKQLVGSDRKDKAKLQAISPTNLAKQIAIPLLIAHGTLDPVASVEHAHQFTAALERYKKDFDYIELEEEGHSLDLPKNQAYLFEKISRFLAKHLK